MFILPWLSGICVLLAVHFLSQKRKIGLHFQVAGSIISVAFFLLTTPIWGYVALNCILGGIAVKGLIQWQK